MELILISIGILVIGLVWIILTFLLALIDLIKQPKENCRRCGKPFKRIIGYTQFCRRCHKDYLKAVEISACTQEQVVSCNYCKSTGRIKKYKCVICMGTGFIAKDENAIMFLAKKSLTTNPDWMEFVNEDGSLR